MKDLEGYWVVSKIIWLLFFRIRNYKIFLFFYIWEIIGYYVKLDILLIGKNNYFILEGILSGLYILKVIIFKYL